MSCKTSTMPSVGLEKARGDVQWLLGTAEEAIAALVTSFGGLTKDTDSILRLASTIVDCVEHENIRSVLANVEDLGVAAKQFVSERLQATSGILDTVATETKLLGQLSRVTESQAKLAFEIKNLKVHTNIEVARLGSAGVDFEHLARELAEFSLSLVNSTDELMSQTDHHRAANEKTQSMLSVELPHLREEFARVESSLNADLGAMNSGLSKLSRTPVQFRQSAEEIAEQIAGVVVAVQSHDITRQQLEHVEEAMAIISSKLSTSRDAIEETDSDAACGHAGLAIQISQLGAIKAIIAEWASQIRTCMRSILRISASELVGIGILVLEQQQSLSSQLIHIDSLERECWAYGESLRSTLDGISHLSELVTKHMQTSASARDRLQLLTFNSVIEASHMGAKADVIYAIADEIAEVLVNWSKISEQSASALQEILNLSNRINAVIATFSQAGSEKLREAQTKTKTGLEHLQSAASFALMQGRKIEATTDMMRTRSVEVEKASELLDSCFCRLDALVNTLENMKLDLEAYHPGVTQKYDEAEIEKLFSAFYTTQTEREVLRAALSGTVFSRVQQDSTGNSVELF